MRGWTFVGVVPDIPKMIIIGAPHTTNWDFVLFLAALHHFRLKVHYLGKHTLFRWPFRRFFEKFGGIPVDRSKAMGVVGQVASAFDSNQEMVLVIAPEGTRGSGRWWKSGFLSIAQATATPVVLAGIDYSTKTITLSDAIGIEDVGSFMDQARDFYRDKRGRYPSKETPVVLREELNRS